MNERVHKRFAINKFVAEALDTRLHFYHVVMYQPSALLQTLLLRKGIYDTFGNILNISEETYRSRDKKFLLFLLVLLYSR